MKNNLECSTKMEQPMLYIWSLLGGKLFCTIQYPYRRSVKQCICDPYDIGRYVIK